MRLLHCTDFHANVVWFRWLAHVASNYDLVCLSGDLLDQSSANPISHPKAEITAILGTIVTPMVVCSGNHDMEYVDGGDAGEREWVIDLRRPNVWVDGDRFHLGGHGFYCQAWNEPISPAKPGEIWVSHAPPEGSMAAVNESGQDHGDYEFGQLCRNARGPRIALCGHVHRPQCWHANVGATRVFNPGCLATAPWPSHIVFELKSGTAILHCHGLPEETISISPETTHEVRCETSANRLDQLLELVVLNQQIEGYRLTSNEIDECRRRLRATARGNL